MRLQHIAAAGCHEKELPHKRLMPPPLGGGPQLGLRPLASRKSKPPSFKRHVPLLLLAALSVYGVWFLYTTQSVADSRRFEDRAAATARENVVDEDPKYVDPVDAVNQLAAAAKAGAYGSEEADASQQTDADTVQCERQSPPPGTLALGFRDGQTLDLVPDGAAASPLAPLSSGAFTISAWVRLPELPNVDVPSIRTILSSKASGCETDTEHLGVALFVNAWNTDSAQLFFSWGNKKSGCEELATERGVVPAGKWAFVVASVDASGHAALFVNAELRASTDPAEPRHAAYAAYIKARGSTSPIERAPTVPPPPAGVNVKDCASCPSPPACACPTLPRAHAPLHAQVDRRLRLGGHTDESHYLRGYLAAVSIHPEALDVMAQRALMCGGHGAAAVPRPLALLAVSSKAQRKATGTRRRPERSAPLLGARRRVHTPACSQPRRAPRLASPRVAAEAR